eukprot:3416427-Pyramimonas_sp.AAC.1
MEGHLSSCVSKRIAPRGPGHAQHDGPLGQEAHKSAKRNPDCRAMSMGENPSGGPRKNTAQPASSALAPDRRKFRAEPSAATSVLFGRLTDTQPPKFDGQRPPRDSLSLRC